jgi:hypothetical protein
VGVQTHVSMTQAHVGPELQVPQDPPQLSSPQSLPAHCGAHWQTPPTHSSPPGQAPPQVPPHPSVPHSLLVQLGTQGQVRGYEGPEEYWSGPHVYPPADVDQEQ